MDRFINELKLDGELKSVGSFSLNQQKQKEKLSRFLLPEAAAYILKLLQWAVLSGAKNIEVSIGKQRVRLGHDGATTSVDDILGWSQHLGSRESRLRSLALAINAVRGVRPRRVVFRQRNNEGTTQTVFDLDGDHVHTDASETSRDSISTVDIDRPATRGSSLARAQFQYETIRHWQVSGEKFRSSLMGYSEAALLRACGLYCPIPVRVNGEFINRPFFGQRCRYETLRGLNITAPPRALMSVYTACYGLTRSQNLGLAMPSIHPGLSTSIWYSFESKGMVVKGGSKSTPSSLSRSHPQYTGVQLFGAAPVPVSCAIIKNTDHLLPKIARATFIFNGVSVHSARLPMLPSDCYALVWGDPEQADLSGLMPLQDSGILNDLEELVRNGLPAENGPKAVLQ